MTLSQLPLLNASLNFASTVLLLAGYVLIRRRMIAHHRAAMLAALCSSTLFLISYLVYHAQVGSVRFTGTGAARLVYFTILISHTVLAAALPPLAVITLVRAVGAKFDRHRRIARWTLPVWLYVSATGVAIYVMLYVLYPGAGS